MCVAPDVELPNPEVVAVTASRGASRMVWWPWVRVNTFQCKVALLVPGAAVDRVKISPTVVVVPSSSPVVCLRRSPSAMPMSRGAQ